MSIRALLEARKHPARDMAIHSIRCIEEGDREGWLSMWAEDGLVEDPVGVSLLDPDGKGHRGIERITAFYDNVIAKSDVRFCIRQSFACGHECANVGTITTRADNGKVTRTELVMVYRLNDQGRLASLRAFWEIEDTVASLF